MRFFLSIVTFASLALTGLSLVACSDDKSTAGIEVGNPSIADTTVTDTPVVKPPVTEPVNVALPLTAGFSIDYGEPENKVLTKRVSLVSEGEPVLLDSFALELTEVRTYASYYIFMSNYNAVNGRQVWPAFEDQDEVRNSLHESSITVSFAEETVVDNAFKNIDLMDGGYLKEIGVSFEPYATDDIHGRVKIDGEYVPFVYDLSNFNSLQLRYHYSQIEIDSVKNVANLSVVFRAKLFTEGVDFSSATVSEDGTIHIDSENNVKLWDELNKRFVPSFQPLRYSCENAEGKGALTYVADVWNGIAADVNENTVINGNFKSPFTTDWILVTQYKGKADTSVIVESEKERIMKVDVAEGGSNSYSVQLLQENVALIEGVKYKCVFTIWSDVADSITVRIGSYDTYETVGFSKHVFVNTSGASIQEEFVAKKSDPFARFELNLGKKKRWFKIKEVQVLRLSE